MRIPCPFCGSRDSAEFSYLGDATVVRPETSRLGADVAAAMYDYVYLRENPAGVVREHWYHAAGCHGWLIVERDTRTHRITAATLSNSGTQA